MNLREFFKGSLFVVLNDAEGAAKLPRVISYEQAQGYNEKKFGVFVSVQGFSSDCRIAENITHINAWAIDIDEGTKPQQMERINLSPLKPNLIIETKNGFHVYWKARDATIAKFATIQNILVPFFKADPNAKDLCRILRYPGFNHWKNPNDPFPVKVVAANHNYAYRESEMISYFNLITKKKDKRITPYTSEEIKTMMRGGAVKKASKGKDVDAAQALSALSGTQHVKGEVYELIENKNGTKQIWVNGKSTANWIAEDGGLGSHDHGGPTIWQWLHWIHKDWRIVGKVMKEVFGV